MAELVAVYSKLVKEQYNDVAKLLGKAKYRSGRHSAPKVVVVEQKRRRRRRRAVGHR